jgi:hypothetical protein
MPAVRVGWCVHHRTLQQYHRKEMALIVSGSRFDSLTRSVDLYGILPIQMFIYAESEI